MGIHGRVPTGDCLHACHMQRRSVDVGLCAMSSGPISTATSSARGLAAKGWATNKFASLWQVCERVRTKGLRMLGGICSIVRKGVLLREARNKLAGMRLWRVLILICNGLHD